MPKSSLSFLLLALSLLLQLPTHAAGTSNPLTLPPLMEEDSTPHISNTHLDMSAFKTLPILHEGRIKPLDTYARVMHQAFMGRKADSQSSHWLATLLFTPVKGLEKPMLAIPNPEVRHALDLKESPKHLFSVLTVVQAMQSKKDVVFPLIQKPENERTLAQSQLVDLHTKVLWALDVGKSLSMVKPIFSLPDATFAKPLNMQENQKYTYLDMVARHKSLITLLEKISRKKSGHNLTAAELHLFRIANLMRIVGEGGDAQALHVLPPTHAEGAWLTPWQFLQQKEGKSSLPTAAYLAQWQKMSEAFQTADIKNWQASTHHAQNITQENTHIAHPTLLKAEVMYNKLDLFKVSLWGYLFLLLGVFIYWRKPHQKMYPLLVWGGFGILTLHLIGIVLRMVILQRPPVATLYESLLFVSLIAVGLSLYIESKRQDLTGLALAGLIGALLQMVALRFAAEGDSMGMLMAVLNTNFWLATHVVIITMGYGFCLVTGFLAHVYLWQRWQGKTAEILKPLYNQIVALTLIALLATTVGTLLGGVWADQSWGRFWGWDPKENGALLIVLWLTWTIHGRISKTLTPDGFIAGTALLNIVVALAWFGVNLLNVGLHSYGFTNQMATNLGIFCLTELLLITFLWQRVKSQRKKHA